MAYQPTEWEHGDIITGGKLNKIEQELTHVADNATYGFGGAQLSSDGLTPFSYINAGDPMPANPQKGDTVFLKDGNDFLIYSYNGEDWVLKIDPDLSNRIEETIKTASDNTDKAIADNNTQINETINQVAKSQADLAIKDGDFNNKAQAMADEALANAKANTATVAQETLNTANENLDAAKQSLTTDLQKEVSDRTTAVATLDSKAQGYADSAKQDAIAAATTADGTINKKIDETASSITSTVSQNKMDAEGKITTAQSTATQALNGLSSKVDTATYNAKTGQLSTDVTNVTQTANQAKTDIASIKQTDITQDARMTTIEADANGTKTTVSNLQKTQNTQSGSISTLQQRADGFDATVTKVDNLSVGGRNYFLNSSGTSLEGWYQTDGWTIATGTNRGTVFTIKPASAWTGGTHNAIYQTGINIPYGTQVTVSFWAKASVNGTKFHSEPNGSYVSYNPTLSTSWTRYSYTFKLTSATIYFMGVDAGTIYYLDDVKIETGNIATDWTPAPEDVDSATAKAQLTADQATTSLNNYKTDADGRISKAQSDIVQTAKDVTTKVSQSDYNSKTSELTTKVSTAQQTADSAVTTVGAYKTSNDNRVSSAETKISQNAEAINLRATKTDLDSAKNDYTAKISQVNIDIDGINSSVSNVTNKLSSLPYISENLMKNSSFEMPVGTLSGPISVVDDSDQTRPLPFGGYMLVVDNASNQTAGDVVSRISIDPVILKANQMYTLSYYFSTAGAAYYQHSDYGVDDSGNFIFGIMAEHDSVDVTGGQMQWKRYSKTFKLAKDVTLSALRFGFVTNKDGRAWKVIDQVKIEQGDKATPYTPNVYDNDYRISSQQITIDGITNAVTQQGKDINSVTSRVQTAEGMLSTATDNISGLQSKQTQTANQISQEITDRTKGDSNTLQSSKDFTTSSVSSAVTGMNSTVTQTANGILAQVEATNMVANSEFDPLNGTWYALSNGGSVGSTAGVAWSATQATGFADWPVVNGSRVISYASATWYTSALVSTSAGKVFSASIVAGRAPAPTVSTALDYRIGFWDSSRKLLTTSSEGNIIDGTAYKGVQKYVVENKTAPANTAFVSVIIAHSSANATDYITRPSLNTGAKASPYTPTYGTSSSSTVLSLFKDNWSIGITDNISKITSGIVGNASQMSLISKNVTIDSPNTQIKGTAWIQSAMIANGAIGSAQIGDATITSAKIAQLDVAKLTGNVSSFIQSNWNGLYQSVKISPIGMTISTSQGSTAQFNQDGLVLDGALGTTNVLNGQIELISSKNEYLGTFQHETMPDHDNVDYLMIKLAGWHTSKPGDSDYDLNSDSSNTIRGGDGIGFGVTNSVGTYDMKMSWDSSLVAGYKGRKAGWHVEDIMTWHQPTYFEGGFDVAQQFSSTDRRALHIQGATLSNGHKWFGFFDTPSQAGFGTDDTNDVLFYVKGKSYSLYTMLNKLSML